MTSLHERGRAWDLSALLALQSAVRSRHLGHVARTVSLFGEHAVGWIGVGMAGAILDPPGRRSWLRAISAVAAAHASSVALKRFVRRPRPRERGVRILAPTLGRWSFPSSHAASTTVAALLFAQLLRRRSLLMSVPVMAASRLALGLHYPSDVAGGVLRGAFVARRSALRHGR